MKSFDFPKAYFELDRVGWDGKYFKDILTFSCFNHGALIFILWRLLKQNSMLYLILLSH